MATRGLCIAYDNNTRFLNPKALPPFLVWEVPGEQDGSVMVLRVGVPLCVDALLPFAEAPQSVVRVVCDL